jgi:hypothetical protein
MATVSGLNPAHRRHAALELSLLPLAVADWHGVGGLALNTVPCRQLWLSSLASGYFRTCYSTQYRPVHLRQTLSGRFLRMEPFSV